MAQGREIRAEQIRRIGERYENNIRESRFYRNARQRGRDLRMDALNRLFENDRAFNRQLDRADRLYNNAILRPVSRNTYMGLNNG